MKEKWVDDTRHWEPSIVYDSPRPYMVFRNRAEGKTLVIKTPQLSHPYVNYKIEGGPVTNFRILKRVEEPDEVSVLLTKDEIDAVLALIGFDVCNPSLIGEAIHKLRKARDK